MNLPDNLKYTKDHEWVVIEGDIATIGITDFAQKELGDIVYVEIETLDQVLAKDEIFGTVEAVKTVSDLFLPLSGEIIEFNEDLDTAPETVNSDPYGAGWMIKMKISDISEVSTPSSNGVLELHEQIDQELSNFITSIQNYETDTVTALENSVDLLISSLNSCNEKIGLNKGAIASYTSNSFYTDKGAYALAYISELFYQQHEENKELYDKIVETEQGLKEAAEEREIQGIWEVVGGVGLLVAGGLCIYFTAGAAAPLVADIGFSIGLGTTIFGVADSEEGIQDICYGKEKFVFSFLLQGAPCTSSFAFCAFALAFLSACKISFAA